MFARARTYYIMSVVLSMALLFAACRETVDEPMQQIELPIVFALPAGDAGAAGAPARLPGDPGTTETFTKPTHAYVFVAFHKDDETTVVSSVVDTTILASDWARRDTIYYYQKTFLLDIPDKDHVSDANVYLAVSDVSLSLKTTNSSSEVRDVSRATKNSWPATEDEIRKLTFAVDNALQSHLQHIYSSPYNYQPDGSHYYGRVANFGAKVPYIHMMLYHVASKVDLMWNVAEDKRDKIRVTQVKATKLFNDADAYLFKPTENSATMRTNGYSYTYGGDAGTWWAGRNYFYTIAYKATDQSDKFPLQLELKTKNMTVGDGGTEYTHDEILLKTPPAVFVPWVRGQFTFSTSWTGNSDSPTEHDLD